MRIDRKIAAHRSWAPMLLGLAVALGGCAAVGPDWHTPDASAPANWSAPAASAAASLPVSAWRDDWWNSFNDPVLSQLVRDAQAQNINVQIALSRIAQARAQRQAATGAYWPKIDGNASATRQKISEKGVATSLGGSSGGGSGGSSSGGQGGQSGGSSTPLPGSLLSPFNLFQVGFDASWELDLWGKVRRQVEAADASADAAVAGGQDARLSLAAEVARTYLQLRGVQAQLALLDVDLNIQKRLAGITRSRKKFGFDTDAEVAQIDAQVASTQAQMPQLQQQQAQLENQLGLLLALPPGALNSVLDQAQPLPPEPPALPAGLPGDLLRRRPDIRQSEAQLHQVTAQIGVAEAALFPSLKLDLGGGFQSTEFPDLKTWAARFFNVGPQLSFPIFQGGQLRANVKIADAAQQQAVLQYRQTVLSAYHDADNALIACAREHERAADLHEQVAQLDRAVKVGFSRYRNGLVPFMQVLQAERDYNQAQQQLLQSQVTSASNLVALYKALGGGWQSAEQDAAAGADASAVASQVAAANPPT